MSETTTTVTEGPEINYVKIYIPFPEEEAGICTGESVWAINLGDGLYKLQNSPLTPGLFWGDIVSAEIVTETTVGPFSKMVEESNAKIKSYLETRQKIVELVEAGKAEPELLELMPVVELDEPQEDVVDTWEILTISDLVQREIEIWADAAGDSSLVVSKYDPQKEQDMEELLTEPVLVQTFEANSPDEAYAIYVAWMDSRDKADVN